MAGIILSLTIGVLIIGAVAGAMWLFVTMAKAWQQNAQDVLGRSSSSSQRRQSATKGTRESSRIDQSEHQDDEP